jgi:Trypsin
LVSSRLALATLPAAILCLLIVAAPAAAIVNGHPDGNDHPNVGALLAPEAFSDGTWADCTGTLISSTVFLTAAHCDLGEPRYAVTFDSVYSSATGTTHWGTWHADPAYRPAQNDPHDLAVIVFDDPVTGITPAQLPAAGALDNLEPGQKFTSVGYGGQAKIKSHFLYTDTRFEAVGALRTMENAWLRISQNPALGNGGTCFGDSGGPNFLGAGTDETPILAATTITGDDACRSTNVVYRLDLPSAREFLGQYVSLP